MTTGAGPDDSVSGAGLQPELNQPPSLGRRLFIGPNGIRAGWRIVIFVALCFAIGRALVFIAIQIPGLREYFATQNGQLMTPRGQLLGIFTPLVVILSAGVMTRIEKRSFADYGLPVSQAFGKRFWQGVPLGFAMLCLLLVLMAAVGAYSLDGQAVTGFDAWKDAALYAFGFICVGVFEEFTFRGYLQSTLGSGIGFWPAAIVLSIGFGAGHLGNQGEAITGAVMAGSFGLLSAFALWRTGNIWFSIGMHASWDWGETCFFGTPDSGIVAQGHILNSAFHGPTWLTGGTVGPEGSVLVFGVLVVWALIIHFWFPAAARAAEKVEPQKVESRRLLDTGAGS
jgi:membrane protease YdiL (CAAX protease family)